MMQPMGGYESKSVSPPMTSPPVMPSGPSQPPPPSTITPPVLQAPPSMPNLTPVSSMAPPPSMPSMPTMPSMTSPSMPPMSMAPPSMNSQSSSQPPSMNSSKRPSGDAGQMKFGGAPPITSAPMMSGAPPTPSGGESKPLQDNNSKQTGNTSLNQSQTEKKSGFFQKFAASVLPRSLTGEVYLPDDKDKSLYYDEQLGRWVDKNAPDEGENKPPPPPMIPKSAGGSDGPSGGGPMSSAGPMGMNGAPGGQGGFRRGGQRKRNMYKDAGVMGEKIRSNISNNPMMTSPSFGSSIPSASMFQPTFQPGSENGNTQPETQTQGDPSQYQPAPATPTTEAANSQSGAPQFFNPTQFGANPPAMPTS